MHFLIITENVVVTLLMLMMFCEQFPQVQSLNLKLYNTIVASICFVYAG